MALRRVPIEDALGGGVTRYEGVTRVGCERTASGDGIERLYCSLSDGRLARMDVRDVDEVVGPWFRTDGDPTWPSLARAIATDPNDPFTCYVERSEELQGPYATLRCMRWDEAADYEFKRMPIWTGEAAAQAMDEFVGRLLGRR